MKKIFWILAVCVFIFSARAVSAFSINPLKYYATIDAGGREIFLVNVKNTGDKILKYRPVALGAVQNKDGSTSFLSGVDVAENWISAKETELEIGAGEMKNFEFVAQVPTGSISGSHYIGLGVDEVSEGGLSGRLVAILHLQVAGIANESLRINEIKPSDYIIFNPEISFSAELKNQSNVDLDIAGNLIVRNYFGREMYNEQIRFGSRLLPQAGREVKNDLSFEKIKLPGIYTATLSAVYGVTQQTISDSFSFLFLPVWSILVFVILVGMLIGFKVFRR